MEFASSNWSSVAKRQMKSRKGQKRADAAVAMDRADWTALACRLATGNAARAN